jgi:hypothetical protein
MPNANTFDIKPIGALVQGYIAAAATSVDPYSRNREWATHTNDLNPATSAQWHMDAIDFLQMLADNGVVADLVILDPPYSPRQVKECYDSIGHKMQQGDALLGAIRKRLKTEVCRLLSPGGKVVTCGWNTVGMGKTLGFEQIEILICCHGSDHNDTLVTVEQRQQMAEVAA